MDVNIPSTIVSMQRNVLVAITAVSRGLESATSQRSVIDFSFQTFMEHLL